MTNIENTVTVKQSVGQVYAYLADCNNHEALMPENIYNWSSTRDEARFTIQNMAKLALKVDQRKEDEEVVFIPSEKAPFDVTLRWTLASEDEQSTKATLRIEADLNMMMKMLASGPLQKLVDHQVSKLAEILE